MAAGAASGADGRHNLIELILYFTLGFLSAAFLAALVAPALWRRATTLTRRRIEASVPLTLDEIRADRDSLRAEYAMEVRRLEMDLKAAREKTAEHAVALAKVQQGVNTTTDEREALKADLSRMDAESRGWREEMQRKDEGLKALSSALTRTEELLAAQKEEFDKLEREFEDAAFASSTRQIEIVAREGEIDRLSSDLAALRGPRAGEAENRRVELLEKKVQALIAAIAERDERLDHSNRELTQLRAQGGGSGAASASATRELREQMQELAAQVVAMTAAKEGKDSPIHRALGKSKAPAVRAKHAPVSLADRIRAIKKSPVS